MVATALRPILFKSKKYAQLTVANVIDDASRALGLAGDGRLNDSSMGVWPAATNLLTAPTDFSNAAWTSGNVTKTSTTQTDPGGGPTGFLGTVVGGPDVEQPVTVSASTVYTFSFWAKLGTCTHVETGVYDSDHTAWISASAAYQASLNASTYTRISVTFTTPVGCTHVRLFLDVSGATSGTMYWAWPQLELGAVATPFTPTSRAAARIQADAGKCFNNQVVQGAVAMRVRMGYASTVTVGFQEGLYELASDGSNYLTLFRSDGSGSLALARYGGAVGFGSASQAATWAAGDILTVVGRWTATRLAISINGVAFATAAQSTIPTIGTLFDIGGAPSGLGATAQIRADVLWLATYDDKSAILSNGDAAMINSFGNSDMGLSAFPGNPSAFMSFKDGWFEYR
jgi:hypothetical protein